MATETYENDIRRAIAESLYDAENPQNGYVEDTTTYPDGCVNCNEESEEEEKVVEQHLNPSPPEVLVPCPTDPPYHGMALVTTIINGFICRKWV